MIGIVGGLVITWNLKASQALSRSAQMKIVEGQILRRIYPI